MFGMLMFTQPVFAARQKLAASASRERKNADYNVEPTAEQRAQPTDASQ
jgi:hypothetical protein